VIDEDVVEVKIKKSEVSFIVWIVPLLALIVGGWLIYQYYAKLGPMVTITFKNSGGLEPKQSQVKFRDVKVGSVEKIEILKEKEGVKVYVRINKDVTPFLNENTKFWIVKPEIDLGKVRGLDALMSGAYIQMYSKLGDKELREFKGLEEQPLVLKEENGKTFKLISQNSYDFSEGTPVYFKQIKVGRVKYIQLSKDKKHVEIYIFIKEPYSNYINITTKFWSLKNFTFNLTDRGLEVQSGSLTQLLLGGIEFDTKDFGNDLKKSETFHLYSSKDEALRKRIGGAKEKFVDFMMQFDEGVGYLNIGSSVKMDGFIVGKVKDIISHFDSDSLKTKSIVITSINVATFENGKKSAFWGLKKAVKKGLVARLKQVNPLVNYMYIELTKDGKGDKLVKNGKYYLFPTGESKINEITKSLKSFMKKIDDLPLKEAVKNLSDSFASIKNLSNDLDVIVKDKDTKALPKSINQSLDRLNKAVDEVAKLSKSYQEDSKFSAQLSQTLKDIDKASKDLQKVLIKVKRKPNSLIFGE
jgi:paraquat-inducible protein B